MSCLICDGTVKVIDGPDAYVIKNHAVYHKQCYDEFKKFEMYWDEVEHALRLDKTLQRIIRGEGIKMSADEFLKELATW